MTIQVTATEAKAKLLSLLNEVEAGEEIEITRRGRVIARLARVKRPKPAPGFLAGMAWTNATDEELFSTGESFSFDRENLGSR